MVLRCGGFRAHQDHGNSPFINKDFPGTGKQKKKKQQQTKNKQEAESKVQTKNKEERRAQQETEENKRETGERGKEHPNKKQKRKKEATNKKQKRKGRNKQDQATRKQGNTRFCYQTRVKPFKNTSVPETFPQHEPAQNRNGASEAEKHFGFGCVWLLPGVPGLETHAACLLPPVVGGKAGCD